MAITRSIAKKHDTNEEVGLQLLFASESGPFAQNKTIRPPFFHHNYYKKGENKIAITKPMEQKFGSAEVGLQLDLLQIFQAFFSQLHNMRIFFAFLLKYGNRFYQTIKAGRGKAGKQGILSHLTAEARIEVKSSMVRKSDNTVFLR